MAASFVAGGMRWWLAPGAAPAETERRVRRALEQAAPAPPGRPGRRKDLQRLSLGAGPGPDHLLKRWSHSGARARVVSKARRELAVATSLAARGVAVAGPVAAGVRRRGGRLVEEWLLVALVPGAVDLAAGAAGLDARRRRRLASQLGALVARAHRAGLRMQDLTPTNVLWCPGAEPELRLIDFERARLSSRPPGSRARARMLAKLERALGDAGPGERLGFVRAYAGGDRRRARLWWRRISRAARRLAIRDTRRWERAVGRGGRRFERGRGGWVRARGPARLSPTADPLDKPDARRVVLRYPGLGRRAARRLFARASALHERGLAPRPVALADAGGAARLLFEWRDAGPLGAEAARSASARLAARLAALGRLAGPPPPEAAVFERGAGGRLRALLLEPRRFRFGRLPRREASYSETAIVPIPEAAMQDPEHTPILSSLADDPELAPAIERFVIDLAERIDRLQDAEALGDLGQLGLLAQRLGAESRRLGFAHLARCAGTIETACGSDDAAGARKAVVEMTDLARRIRLGHRGAA